MIVLDSAHPPVALWFIGLNEVTDFMGCLQLKPGSKDCFTFDFRFRHHKDNKLFEETKDVKNWYHTEHSHITEENAVHLIRGILLRLCQIPASDDPKDLPRLHELVYANYANFAEFIEAFRAKTFIFERMASPEDEKRWGLSEAIKTKS
jgi:hypothetical protein